MLSPLQNVRFFFLLCVAALPFEMIISVARHQLAIRIGPLGYLLHPTFGMAVSGCFLQPHMHVGRRKWFLAFLAIYAVGLGSSGLVTGSVPFFLFSVWAMGPLFMAFSIVIFADSDLLNDAIVAFVIGISIWSIVYFLFFLWTAHVIVGRFPVYNSFPFGEFMMALRSPGEDLWRELYYFRLLGNFNKQANILMLSLILASYLYVEGRLSLKGWSVATMPIAIMFLLMFSRGAFVALILVAIGLLATSALVRRPIPQLSSASIMLLIVFVSLSNATWRAYWHDQGSMVEREEMAEVAVSGSATILKSGELVTRSSENLKSCSAREPERTAKFFVFGYGLGNFGPSVCRGSGAETHNAFIDAWVQGGLVGFVGYTGLFVVAFTLGIFELIRSRFTNQVALFGLAVVCSIAVLGMREYALVYLWVQSAGGFLLALGIAMIVSKNSRTNGT